MASKNDIRQKPPISASAPSKRGSPWSLIQDQLKSASSIWESDEPVKAAECQSEIDRRNLLRELRRKLEALGPNEPATDPTPEE